MSPGHDEIGGYSLNSPAKMPKMETVKEEPGGCLVRASSVGNLRSMSMGGMSGGIVKTEDGATQPNKLMCGLPIKVEGAEEEGGSEGYSEGRPDQHQLQGGEGQDKQKSNATAARIRGALEASGLSGNLTSEDLQTLKRLNEIAKSTGLTQEQKSGEASQLLKNNPNVSRLLLKLRTEKNNQAGPTGRVGPMATRAPEGSHMGLAPAMGGMEPGYPGMQSQARPQGPGSMVYGGPAGYGGPQGPGSAVYRSPGGHQWAQGSPGPQDSYYRGGMVPGVPGRGGHMAMMQDMGHMGPQPGMRMHPEMVGPGGPGAYGAGGYTGAMGMRMPGGHMYTNMGPMDRMGGRMMPMEGPQTMYVNRQTGMMYQRDSMMTASRGGPPPGYGAGPQSYMQGSFHPGMMSRAGPVDRLAPGPRSPYGAVAPGISAARGQAMYAGSPQGAGHGGFESFGGQGGDMTGRGRWEEGRENLLTSMPRVSPQPLPPVSESQLRARLSGVTTTTGATQNSELANRLMTGKTYDQAGYGPNRTLAGQQPQFQDNTESLFEEINNSQFLTNTSPYSGGKFDDFSPEKIGGSWKESQNTNSLRSGWLRRLSTALETSANINSPDAANRMAAGIEEKAFQNADTEANYTNNIAVQLARIFSRSKEATPTSSRPDSTSWPEDGAGGGKSGPSSTSPNYGPTPTSQGHFHTDTTLNCFQVN